MEKSTSEKKIALVTGGGKGIGAACCVALAKEGFCVAVHYNKSAADAEALVATLPDAFAVQGDISTPEGIDKLCEEVKKHEGVLSVLVNNAGVVFDNPIFGANLDEFEKTVNTNLRGTWYITKKVSRMMMRKKSGRIINISSVIGSTGNPAQSIYGMTKAGIDNLTKTLAMELAMFGILVNSVAPGFIDTDMTKDLSDEIKKKIAEKIPLGRTGTPAEVAEVVAFLATKGSYCTGSVFHVNGGMYGG